MKWMKRLTAFALAAVTVFTMPMAAYAKKTTESGSVFIRARLDYSTPNGMSALSDKCVTLSSGKWKADGEYYYYDSPVEPGQTVEFISSVRIPEEWGNGAVGKQFSILVTAEAAECLPGETGWNSNQEAAYIGTFDVMKGEQQEQGYKVKKGNISLTIKEYQVGEDGKLKTYENNKVVVPGQEVSKVVKITVNGKKSTRTKKDEDDTEEKKSTEAVTTPPNNADPNGGTPGTGLSNGNGQWDGKLVRTGDESQVGALIVAIGVCAAGLIGVTVYQKIRRKKYHE